MFIVFSPASISLYSSHKLKRQARTVFAMIILSSHCLGLASASHPMDANAVVFQSEAQVVLLIEHLEHLAILASCGRCSRGDRSPVMARLKDPSVPIKAANIVESPRSRSMR